MNILNKINKKEYCILALYIILVIGYSKISDGWMLKLADAIALGLLCIFNRYISFKTNKKASFVSGVIIILLLFYLILDGFARIGFGFHLNDILGDAIAILLATNTGEVFSFFDNFKLKYFSKIALPILGVILYFYQARLPAKGYSARKFKLMFASSLASVIFLLSLPKFPINITISSIPQIIKNIDVTEEYLQEKEKFHWNAVSNVKDNSTVVIILGETTRGDHMYINGYSRNTTPNLAAEDIISFKNAISIGAHTLASTPYMLTRKEVSENWISKLWPEKSIISAFKEAGYETYYISYLSNVHSGDNAINQIVNEADHYIRRPYGSKDYDIAGIPIIEDILKNNNVSRKLIVYKIVGSHYNFHDRYPSEFDKFQPSFQKTEFKGPNPDYKDTFINTYDNSILYTDFVVSQVLNLLKKQSGETSLSFISDHGIGIYEDGKTLYLNSKKANYNIACFFWFNDEVKGRIGDTKIQRLKDNIDKPIDQTYFIDTVFDISGLESEKRVGKSLFDNISDNDNRFVFRGNTMLKYTSL